MPGFVEARTDHEYTIEIKLYGSLREVTLSPQCRVLLFIHIFRGVSECLSRLPRMELHNVKETDRRSQCVSSVHHIRANPHSPASIQENPVDRGYDAERVVMLK